MPHNYNVSLFQRAIELFNIKDGIFFRNDLPFTLTPVIPITPIARIVRWGNSDTTGAIVLYTTPSDKDFYLTSAHLAYSKNSACDIATGYINIQITIGGVTQVVLASSILTLTAERDTATITFSTPIKCDRSTSISLSASSTTFTVGAISRIGSITGYVENTLS